VDYIQPRNNRNVYNFITGPPTHSVGGSVSFCSLTSVIVICNTPWQCRCNVTHQGAARDGEPVLLCPVMAHFVLYNKQLNIEVTDM